MRPNAEKSLVLIGLMGAGKSAVGRVLARRMDLPFVDADREIEAAAGCSIPDIFDLYGEAAFRDGERKVLARLLKGPRQVIATGGGAYMNAETRALIVEHGLSIWLDASLDILVERTGRKTNRPLLANAEDPRAVLKQLMDTRYPVYAEADLRVESRDVPVETTAAEVEKRVREALGV